MAVPIPAPVSRHLLAYVGAAVAAIALVISVLVGMAVADSDPDPAVRSTPAAAHDPAPPGFAEGSPDAIEHRSVTDPQRYGSADAAEEWNR